MREIAPGGVLRAAGGETRVSALCKLFEPGVRKIASATTKLIRTEVRNEAATRRDRLVGLGASEEIVRGLVRLFELDGVFGLAALAARRKVDEVALTEAYTRLGEGVVFGTGGAPPRSLLGADGAIAFGGRQGGLPAVTFRRSGQAVPSPIWFGLDDRGRSRGGAWWGWLVGGGLVLSHWCGEVVFGRLEG